MDIFNLRNNILPSIAGRGRGVGLLCLLSALFVCCDPVPDSERLIYVEPPTIVEDEPTMVGLNVLIEDFTGQSCVNCPNATLEIGKLQEAYGHDNVVAVGIYSGSFGRSRRGVPYSLTTEIGDEYFAHWELDSQPIGMVNRQSPSDYTEWGTQIRSLLQLTAKVKLEPIVSYDETTRTITIDVTATAMECAMDAKLQLWLTEDNIVDFQYIPETGRSNPEYVHNHVFRDAVNGTWGTDIHVDTTEPLKQTFTYTIPEDKTWKVEDMNVVVFVYTDQGVEQVETAKLKTDD